MEERIRKIYEFDVDKHNITFEEYISYLFKTYDVEKDIYNSFDEMIERYEVELGII